MTAPNTNTVKKPYVTKCVVALANPKREGRLAHEVPHEAILIHHEPGSVIMLDDVEAKHLGKQGAVETPEANAERLRQAAIASASKTAQTA